MKKLLFIAPSPLYLEKGSSLRMFAILKILSRYYKIDLVTYSTGKEFTLDNVVIYRTSRFFKPNLAVGIPSISKLVLDFLMYLKIIRLSLFNHYNVVHCEDFEGIALGYFSGWFNKKSVYVYDLHNRILDNLHLKTKAKSGRDNFLLFLENLFVKKTDKIILNWGKYLYDKVLSQKPCFLYYDPIDTNSATIKNSQDEYLIYTGNFEEYQGLGDFIPVFAKSNVSYKLYLVGMPTEKIINLIKKYNCTGRIEVLGRRTVQETNALIKNSICGILPRRSGSCMKAIHYILWNKPVIAKDTDSNREMVTDEYNGYLYSNNEKLLSILEAVQNDKKALESLQSGIEKTKKRIFDIWAEDRFIKEYEK
jgi:glycosyltransferase involved in cell wall biosynthesis